MPNPDENKKKDLGQQVEQAHEQYGEDIAAAAQQEADDIKAANDAYAAAMATAETARQQGAAEVRKSIEGYLNDGYNAQQAILKSAQDEVEKAKAEDEALTQASYNAARWTGATELAASVANLIAVGGFRAENQKYHQYSQDWMKTADEQHRYRLNRIDNLRERQRAIQQQLLQMKMAGGSTLAQLDAGENNARYTHAAGVAGAGREMAVKLAGIKAGAATEAAKAKVEGGKARATIEMQEKKIAADRANTAATNNTRLVVAGMKSGGSGGDKSIIQVALPPEKTGEKARVLTIKQGSLLATINANLNLFKSDDQKAIERILRDPSGSQDDKAKKMQQFIKTSPEIVRLLSKAGKLDYVDWDDQPQQASGSSNGNSGSNGSVGRAFDLDKALGIK